jgi:hypothetical protein
MGRKSGKELKDSHPDDAETGGQSLLFVERDTLPKAEANEEELSVWPTVPGAIKLPLRVNGRPICRSLPIPPSD